MKKIIISIIILAILSFFVVAQLSAKPIDNPKVSTKELQTKNLTKSEETKVNVKWSGEFFSYQDNDVHVAINMTSHRVFTSKDKFDNIMGCKC